MVRLDKVGQLMDDDRVADPGRQLGHPVRDPDRPLTRRTASEALLLIADVADLVKLELPVEVPLVEVSGSGCQITVRVQRAPPARGQDLAAELCGPGLLLSRRESGGHLNDQATAVQPGTDRAATSGTTDDLHHQSGKHVVRAQARVATVF